MTKTSTGITLREYWRTGDYVITQPDKPDIRLTAVEAGTTRPLDTMQIAADLTDGYWLRNGEGFVDTEGRKYTEWTWIQL